MPKLTINGTEIEVPAGTSILQAAEMLGVEVPRFCYHDKLSVPANCRMCLVEVSPGPPKPQASCALACADGMVVKTDSEMVHKARKGVMEMMLINHPLDCPICDQGGECDLQDQATAYGFDRSRYYESKRAKVDPELGPLIKTSMNRCIQCTRCIRFADEIAGTPDLGLVNRGEDVEITTFVEKVINTELSGNLIDVCPVGALLSKPYSFTARPWELRKTESIDVHDAVGSNIRIDTRGNEIMRILPRLHEDVNEEWINDRTRFAYDGLKRQRLDQPYIRGEKSGKLKPATWEEAFGVVARKLLETKPGWRVALAGDLCDVESMVALKDLMTSLHETNLECRTDGAFYDASQRAGYLFNTTIAGIDQADAILLVGTNPRWEATMVNARIRKNWVNRRVRVGLIGEAVDLSYPYEYLGATPQDLENLMKGRGGFADILGKAKNPMIVIGMGAFQRDDGELIHALARSCAEAFNMVRPDWNGFNVLHTAASRVGALDIGFYTKSGIDLGRAELVYLLGADDFPMDYINKDAFVIYQGHHGDAGANRADVILPGAAYTEKNGLYVNMEGRVQMSRKAVDAPGEAREDWKIIRALSAYISRTLPYDDLFALRERIVREWPHMGQIDRIAPASWGAFGGSGKPGNEPFASAIQNFYMTNVITRASVTMAECTRVFLQNDMAKAAE